MHTENSHSSTQHTHTSHWANQVSSPFMGVENKLKDWMLDLMGKYSYDTICSARTRPAACPHLPLFQPPSMMQASVINVLTCIIDAWHYDNGSKSTHGEEGVRIVWSVWREGITGENGVTEYDWTSSGPQMIDRPLPIDITNQKCDDAHLIPLI